MERIQFTLPNVSLYRGGRACPGGFVEYFWTCDKVLTSTTIQGLVVLIVFLISRKFHRFGVTSHMGNAASCRRGWEWSVEGHRWQDSHSTDYNSIKDSVSVLASFVDVWIRALASLQNKENWWYSQMEIANLFSNHVLVSICYLFRKNHVLISDVCEQPTWTSTVACLLVLFKVSKSEQLVATGHVVRQVHLRGLIIPLTNILQVCPWSVHDGVRDYILSFARSLPK